MNACKLCMCKMYNHINMYKHINEYFNSLHTGIRRQAHFHLDSFKYFVHNTDINLWRHLYIFHVNS